MLPVREADELSVSFVIILVKQQAELLKIGTVYLQVNIASFQNTDLRSFFKKSIEGLLQRINAQSAVPAQRLERLALQYPFTKPNKAIEMPSRPVIPGEQNT